MDDEGEFSALRASFGQQLARQPWPIEGDTLVMSSDWNGPKLFGSNVFLNLYQGEKVLVTHRNREGLLYGSVVDAASDRSGWFGGKGCQAAVEVVLPVPLGPAHALSSLPMGPPDIDLPIGAEEDDPEVEAYILRHGIDSAAAQALWELEPGLRSQVIQSDLTNCRNPSAVLLCRIDRVRGTAVPTPAPPRGPKHVPAPPPPQALKAPTHQLRSRSPPRRAPVAVQQAPPPPPLPYAAPAPPEAVEDFILEYGLDEKAAQALREVSPEQQSMIIDIELSNCRNPSAVVVSRIQCLGVPTNHVESYIQEFGLDDKCAAELRALSPIEQQQVIEARPSNARNPSAVVISRIQAVRNQVQQGGAVEEYLARNGIEDTVCHMLRALPPEAQRQIVASDLSNCRNPSAVLISRIRTIEAQMPPQPPQRPPPPALAPPQPRPPPAPQAVPPPSTIASSAEAFIQRSGIDAEAAQALHALPTHLQQEVIQRGELINCRNPSKVLLSRIRQLGVAV
mmetsp:Transcript_100519/g.244486  ORF Transcript_100519/g.244486 Transcript_100519/m.244486 type:complete len:508 (-) Transcript_100519:128-1651(-)